ncbi:MAG: hypothetical protein ACODAU_12735, partial [Myxococcota bacterium]
GPDAAVTGPRPVFDPSVLEAPDGRFFDLPFPSALRTDADGRPLLDGFPNAVGLVASAIEVVEQERPGFSGAAPIYFRFTDPLDPTSLPADPAASWEEASTVQVVDIDPESPSYGSRFPAHVTHYPEMDLYYPGNALVVRPVPGWTLRPGTRHAVVVRRGIRAADGEPLVGEPAFEALKAAGGTTPVEVHYAELFDALEALDVPIPREEVLVATSFTTTDPAVELDELREEVHAAALPAPDWGEAATGSGYVTYRGTFDTLEFFSGEPPYTSTFGEGAFRFGPDGAPLDVELRPVEFALTVPTGTPPADGYPVVVYGHGTGGGENSHTYAGREGPILAGEGLAVLGIEAALHESRSAGLESIESLLFVNPVAAREMVRQTAADFMLVHRMIAAGAFDVPSSATGGSSVPLAAEPTLFMGHSQGSQEAGLLLGVEPDLDAAFLSAGGGGALVSIFEREFEGQVISCIIAPLIQIQPCERFTPDHPVAHVVQALLDPADPLHFAHRVVRERASTASAVSVAMTEGTADTYTPPSSIEALAVGIGLPIAEPVVQTTLPYVLWDSPAVAGEVQDNLSLPGGRTATGALMQWEDAGHFAIYDLADARDAYVTFLTTAAEGAPTLPAR